MGSLYQISYLLTFRYPDLFIDTAEHVGLGSFWVFKDSSFSLALLKSLCLSLNKGMKVHLEYLTHGPLSVAYSISLKYGVEYKEGSNPSKHCLPTTL